MLVLSRKEGESILIGDNVRVTINAIKGNRITLGIDADREVKIIRGELKPYDHSDQAAEPKEQQQSESVSQPQEMEVATR